MKNFIFLSPNFPESYWRFCRGLKENGFRVLGVGDCPYNDLSEDLRANLDEYYKVDDLEHYEEVYRAVAFFAFKYGKADFLESNNEYWLERDARLRADFHITSGFQPEDMPPVKFKSLMKEKYARAGIPAARWCVAEGEPLRRFAAEVGYPIVVKPDNGVGANETYRISSEEELTAFAARGLRGYIAEEYVFGEVCSYDAIVNAAGEPVFETGNITPASLMDVVNERSTSMFFIVKELAADVREKGRAALKSFGVKNRFVHFEFFRLLRNCRLGKEGEIVALEVNMRPSGGCSPDMMNYANSVDVYRIWADTLAGAPCAPAAGKKQFCAFVGRREKRGYALSRSDVFARYGEHMIAVAPVPAALSPAMGDTMYLAVFPTEEETRAYLSALSE